MTLRRVACPFAAAVDIFAPLLQPFNYLLTMVSGAGQHKLAALHRSYQAGQRPNFRIETLGSRREHLSSATRIGLTLHGLSAC